MAFWSKTPPLDHPPPPENPFRQYDPVAFDKGAKINEVAASVRRLASSEVQGSDLLVALQTALGAEVAASIVRRNPNAGADSKLYIIDQVLDGIAPGVREAAYIAADLPDPQPHRDRELTEEEFSELTNRIVNAATKNNVPVTESVTATAKALGLIICLLGERPDVSVDKLIEFAQQAVADFTRQGIEFRSSQGRDVPVEKIDSRHHSGIDVMTTPSEFEGVPISRLVDTRHELTALIKQNLYGGGSKPEGQAALIARNHLDDFVFRTTDDMLVKGKSGDLAPLKRAIILETYSELLAILDDYSRRFP